MSAYTDVPFGVVDPDYPELDATEAAEHQVARDRALQVRERAEALLLERDARALADEIAEDRARASLDPERVREKLVRGGSFVFDVPDDGGALWGGGDQIAWAMGESCMLYSPPGVGKTTLAGLLVRGRLGLSDTVLGMPIKPGAGRVLYLAMDRPQQIARALRRQFAPEERAHLDERLVVLRGPLPTSLAAVPTLLRDLAREHGADTIIVDSLKDAAPRLAEDEGGLTYNAARQHALSDGVELLELHHARKASGDGRRALTMDDVYGSTWLSAGAGGILALTGEHGADVVEVASVKTARGDVGPLRVRIDRTLGHMQLEDTLSILDALSGQGSLLAHEVARIVHGREATPAETQKARRQLDLQVTGGTVEAVKIKAETGGKDRTAYRLAETLSGVSR